MIGKKFCKNEYSLEEYQECAEWCNANNACIVDKGDFYEVVSNSSITATKKELIAELKMKLSATDYKCLKFVDGALSEEEYASVREERAKLREQLNALN